MMVVFFFGIGGASILTGFAGTPLQMGIGLFAIGFFAAIYHPVGLAIVTMKWRDTGMRLAVNGVWGNLGVACAALITGYLIDNGGWRAAFILPGLFSLAVGVGYAALRWRSVGVEAAASKASGSGPMTTEYRRLLIRLAGIVFLTAALGSIVYQSTTFALPKMFDERVQGFALSLAEGVGGDIATIIGALAFVVFAVASTAQLVVGVMLDKYGPRPVFMTVAAFQIVFFALSPGLTGAVAVAAALGFMLGAFGQIPINDFMIGKMASGAARSRIFALRYVVSFTVLAATLPLIAFVYDTWGFDTLYRVLAGAAVVIFGAVSLLPKKLPVA